MKKADILTPGNFDGMPHSVAGRRDLSSNAKLAYWGLLRQLRGGQETVRANLRLLVEQVGQLQRTLLRSLDELERQGWIERIRTPGKTTCYRLLAAAGNEPPSSNRPIDTSVNPVTSVNSDTSVKVGTGVVTDLTLVSSFPPMYPLSGNKEKTPPPPPTAGGACGLSASPQTTQDGGQEPAGDQHENQRQATEARLQAAYVEVFGVEMPKRWRRRLAGMNGSAAVFAQVRASDIRECIRLTAQAKPRRAFGFGHLENFMLERSAGRKSAEDAEQARQKASQEAAAASQRSREEQDQRKRRRENALVAFDGLSADDRQRWVAVVRSRPGGHRISEDLARYQAAELASTEAKS